MLSESTSKTETQNDPEYMLYFPSQDYRHDQNQTMALGFVFLGFNFHCTCFPETEGIFLTKQSSKNKCSGARKTTVVGQPLRLTTPKM